MSKPVEIPFNIKKRSNSLNHSDTKRCDKLNVPNNTPVSPNEFLKEDYKMMGNNMTPHTFKIDWSKLILNELTCPVQDNDKEKKNNTHR